MKEIILEEAKDKNMTAYILEGRKKNIYILNINLKTYY